MTIPDVSPDTFKDKVALVTGATRGFGFALSSLLAGYGAHVIAVGRTQGGLEQLDDQVASNGGGQVILTPLDLRDHQGIFRLCETIEARWGRLDMLVGNAADLGTLMPLSQVSGKTWANIWQVNLEANWHLIRASEALLRASGQGRALFLSSSVASKGRAFWGPYAASKAALEVMVASWAAEMSAFGLVANCLNPGAMATDMRASAFPGEDPKTLTKPETVAKAALGFLSPDMVLGGGVYRYANGQISL